jgi:cobyrinic acid a,c-diamide synthase
MGLTPYQEHPDTERAIAFAETLATNYLDIDEILRIARDVEPLEAPAAASPSVIIRHASLRIGVIRDSAFQFYYPENFEELKAHGASLIEISALTGKELPDIDALYIGGGFPETHAIALAENLPFRDSLRNAVSGGLPVYAECGGLMYLGRGLLLGTREYPMADIFPLVFSLEKKPQAHGYSIVEVVSENPFYPQGTLLKGHEFHYSRPLNTAEEDDRFSYAFKMKRGHGIHGKRDGICFKNVLATYTHVHARGTEEWARGLIGQALRFREKKAFLKA